MSRCSSSTSWNAMSHSTVRPRMGGSTLHAVDVGIAASHPCSQRHQMISPSLHNNRAGEVPDIAEAEDPTRSFIKKKLRAPICIKLTLFICLSVMVASGVPELVLWRNVHQQLVRQIERRLETVSTLRQEQLKAYMYSEADKIQLISIRLIIVNYLNKAGSNKTAAVMDLNGSVAIISEFKHAAVYTNKGRLALATDNHTFQTQIQETYVNSITQDLPKLHIPVQTSEGWTYLIARGIFQNRVQLGILMVVVNATKLMNLVYDKTGLEGTGELLVGVQDDQADIIRLLLPALHNRNVTVLPFSGALAAAINGESGIMRERDYQGKQVIAAYRPVGFLGWGLLAQMEVKEAYAPVRSVRLVIIITTSVFLCAGAVASLGLAKIFTSPIIELGKAASALGRGEMRTRVDKGSYLFQDEISNLKDAFNGMAHQIASHQYVLEHKVRERTSELAHANDGLAREIQGRRRIELELENAKDVAMAADRSKSEFLANMSHEIRTPLNAIINFTELCLDGQITPEQQEHLDYVQFSAQHLLRLITDILDFSKIESGKLEIEAIQFSLYEQLEQSLSVLAARALKNGLELGCRFTTDVPDQVLGDPGRLLQIFVNLIGNGIKFTKKGEVVVSVSVKSMSVDAVELVFAVSDTGLGIPQNKQCLLFQAFSQVDSSTQRVYGGTGLGLAISSKLASAMGGKMWVVSDGREGLGSTFWFTTKFKIPPSCNHVSTTRFDMLKGLRALVVDDNYSSRAILVDLLKSWDVMAVGVDSVEAAQAALEQQMESGQNFNVVLLDMWLDESNASDLVYFLCKRPDLLEKYMASAQPEAFKTKFIRPAGDKGPLPNISDASGEKHPGVHLSCEHVDNQTGSNCHNLRTDLVNKLPVIMLTSVNHTDSRRCKELGISFYTSKPIKRSLLRRALLSVLGIQDTLLHDEAKTLKGLQIPNKNLHILIAEDNVVNQRVAIKLLQKWGHTAAVAGNGAEAVELAAKEAFDLILMDVQMPVCDGFEATTKIREYERAHDKRRMPIVAMTAHAMTGDGESCIAAGMDHYISKPLNAKKLQELLQHVASGTVNMDNNRASTS